MDYHKLNQVVTPIAAAVLGVVIVLEQMHTSPGTCMWLLTLKMPLSLLLSIRFANSSCLSDAEASNASLLSCLRDISIF